MPVESGKTYIIINAKSGTVLDVGDGNLINGYQRHGGPNQTWLVENNGSHWTIRSLSNGQHLGRPGEVGDGLKLYTVDHPVEWDIWPDKKDNSLDRIYVPGWHTAMNIDLSDHGNGANGTPVTLWGEWDGQHQAWRFQQI